MYAYGAKNVDGAINLVMLSAAVVLESSGARSLCDEKYMYTIHVCRAILYIRNLSKSNQWRRKMIVHILFQYKNKLLIQMSNILLIPRRLFPHVYIEKIPKKALPTLVKTTFLSQFHSHFFWISTTCHNLLTTLHVMETSAMKCGQQIMPDGMESNCHTQIQEIRIEDEAECALEGHFVSSAPNSCGSNN